MITLDEFKKSEIRIGKVLKCEKVENADKLLKLQVDFGDFKRQIVSGIAESFSVEELVGKKLPFIVVAPQVASGKLWDPDLVVLMLKDIISN